MRINLRLWYALKAANLMALREAPMSDPQMTMLLLAYWGQGLLVLDLNLSWGAFAIEEGVPVQGPPAPPALKTQTTTRSPLPIERPGSIFEGRWMVRH